MQPKVIINITVRLISRLTNLYQMLVQYSDGSTSTSKIVISQNDFDQERNELQLSKFFGNLPRDAG